MAAILLSALSCSSAYYEETEDWWFGPDNEIDLLVQLPTQEQADDTLELMVGLLAQVSAGQLDQIATTLQSQDQADSLPAFAIFGQAKALPADSATANGTAAQAGNASATSSMVGRLTDLILLPLTSAARTQVPHKLSDSVGGAAGHWVVAGVCLAVVGLLIAVAVVGTSLRRRGEEPLANEDSYQVCLLPILFLCAAFFPPPSPPLGLIWAC